MKKKTTNSRSRRQKVMKRLYLGVASIISLSVGVIDGLFVYQLIAEPTAIGDKSFAWFFICLLLVGWVFLLAFIWWIYKHDPIFQSWRKKSKVDNNHAIGFPKNSGYKSR